MLKLKLQYFGHLMRRADSFAKTLMLGKIEGRRSEDEMIRWHHRLNGHVLAWRIPGTAEPGGLLSMGSHRVGHD